MILGPSASPHDQPRGAVAELFEHKRPGHHRRGAWPRHPAEDEAQARLVLKHVKAVDGTGEGGKEGADCNRLEMGHDAVGASPATVVDEVVAVPSSPTARSHLHEPRPYVVPWAPNRDGVRDRRNRPRNQLVAGKRAPSLDGSRSH